MSNRLHILLSASQDVLCDCLSQIRDGDHVLLADRGVECLFDATHLTAVQERCSGALSALEVDVVARGLRGQADVDGVALVDDENWVLMVVGHDQVLSWK